MAIKGGGTLSQVTRKTGHCTQRGRLETHGPCAAEAREAATDPRWKQVPAKHATCTEGQGPRPSPLRMGIHTVPTEGESREQVIPP